MLRTQSLVLCSKYEMRKFPHVLGFKSLDPIFGVSKQGLCFTAIEEDGGDKRLVELELACQILFSLAITAIVEASLMRTFAKQVPSLHRVAPRYLKLIISSNCWPFMLISALMLFVLLLMILLLSVLTSIPYAVALSTCLLVRSAAHKIDDISKTYVAYEPSSNGNRCIVVIECFLCDLHWEQIEQDG